jgi:uncharacterized phiE125 gp8 family phage protein
MKKIISKSTDLTSIVSLAEIKAHCRIDNSDNDTLLAIYRAAAVDLIEQACDIDITETIYEESFPRPANQFFLTALPITSVNGFEYWDSNNVAEGVQSENYTVYLPNSARGIVTMKPGFDWPEVYNRPDAIVITYTVGGGVPATLIKAAVLLQIGSFYEHRENETEVNLKPLSIGVQRIIDLYREMKY